MTKAYNLEQVKKEVLLYKPAIGHTQTLFESVIDTCGLLPVKKEKQVLHELQMLNYYLHMALLQAEKIVDIY